MPGRPGKLENGLEEAAYARYSAEFLGTFLLVFTVGCNLVSSPAWAATSIACVLMIMIYALNAVSGANFNPAVSLALGLAGRLAWKEVAIYCAVQLAGGLLAGLAYGVLLWQAFRLGPGKGYGWWEMALAEAFYTFMLCFVVLNVACARLNTDRNQQFYGLAIGFVIVAGGYSVGHISGGCFNPAVALGIDAAGLSTGFGWCLAYAAAELIGAVAAAGAFWVVRPEDFNNFSGYSGGLGPKLVSEFIGTFFLVLTVGLNVIGSSEAPVWSIAAALMCMIYALGTRSGAHFNPAVTFAILLSGRGKCKIFEGLAFMGIQFLAGIIAALTYTLMEHGKSFKLEPGDAPTGGYYGWGQVAVAEIMFTFVLCVVVLCTATVERPLTEYVGLAVASCVTAGGYAIGNISGGSLNPAVSLGISCNSMFTKFEFYNCLIYMMFEFVGAGIAAGVFMGTRPSEFTKSGRKLTDQYSARMRLF